MVTLQDMADALDLKPKKDRKGFAAYGEIKSINPDNTYQVSLNGSDTTVKCARLTGAHVGDVVLVNVLDNGYAVVTGCVGGDTDAGDALDLATDASSDATTALNVAEGVNEHFWYDSTGAHVTEDTQEDYQQDPSSAGGNTLITSQGMAIRKGTTELASFGQNSIILGEQDGSHMQINRDKVGYYVDDVTVATINCSYGYDEDEDVGEKNMELKVISPYRTDDKQKSSLILKQDYVSGVNHPDFAKLQAIDEVYNTEVSVTAEIDGAQHPTLYLKCKNALFTIERDSMNQPLASFNGDISAEGKIRGLTEDLTASTTITATAGTLDNLDCRRFGNTVQLTIRVHKTSATAQGANIFEGTLSTTGIRPAISSMGCGYFGTRNITGAITNAGAIVIRNCGESLPANNTVSVSFTYLVN